MADKSIGSKILGTFFERPDSPDEAPAIPEGQKPADVIAELARGTTPGAAPEPPPAAPPIRTPPITVMPPIPPAGAPRVAAEPVAPPAAARTPPVVPPLKVDFDKLFRDAGLDVGDLDRVRKAEELLKGLPAETPLSLQKTIVEASLKAFGFDVAKIVGAANNQLKAVDTYVKVHEASTTKANQDAEAQINALREKIAKLLEDIDKRSTEQLGLAAAAEERKAQVRKVLEFFEGPPK